MQRDSQQRKLLELAAERLLEAAHSRKAASSSYDFVKIKVRLGSQLEHYYILSRFLLSRMLTVITLPQHKAVRIALDVKKHLVDHERLEITQDELEEVLFALLRQRGYGDEYVRRYQMVTRFFQQKRPLIILIAGSACTGKSSLAQQLASRLNLPNVLQTDVLYELLRASGIGDLPAEPLWRRELPAGASLVSEFQRECATIRHALDGDLCKCIRDGKSIIIEGLHIDPGLFLLEFNDPRGRSSPAPISSTAEGDPGAAQSVGQEPPPAAASAVEALQVTTGQLSGLQVADAAVSEALEAACAHVSPAQADSPGHAASAVCNLGSAASTSQQPTVTAATLAGATPEHAQGSSVRRCASFGDAVQRLTYSGLHRLQSPWREHGSQPLARPRSARAQSLERGQAVFMLQSLEAGASEEAEVMGSAPPPLPSPRPAISLPPVLPQRSISMPAAEHRRRLRSSGAQQTVPEEVALVLSEERQRGTTASGSTEQLADGAADTGGSAAASSGEGAAGSRQQEGSPGGPPAATTVDAPLDAPVGAGAAAEQRVHTSVAVADAAAAAAAGSGPVFVPICLSIRDEEYDGLLQDWLERQQRAIDGAGGSDPATASAAAEGLGAQPNAEAARRLRQLQEHLRKYIATGVPVVEFSTSDMGQALDAMHAYVLQCIELALN